MPHLFRLTKRKILLASPYLPVHTAQNPPLHGYMLFSQHISRKYSLFRFPAAILMP
jgi:hypothetical protein